MSEPEDAISAAQRTGYLLGLGLCLGTPAVAAALMLGGVVPPGTQAPVGDLQQVGYLFTGLVFLSSTWVLWRRGQVLRSFPGLSPHRKPGVILRETLLYAAIFEVSSLLGLAYWLLVGAHAARHAWGFLLMTPILFLALVPRAGQWDPKS